MGNRISNKAFLGLGRWMIPLPDLMIKNDVRSMGQLICRETALVTEEERKLHRFVVKKVTDTNQPVLPEDISSALDMPLDQVLSVIEKLESLKVFLFRYNSTGVNWAYPVTSDERKYNLIFHDGKKCTAA